MTDHPGDPDKKLPNCGATQTGDGHCANLVETSSATDFEGETYSCALCGERYRLYYEDMA